MIADLAHIPPRVLDGPGVAVQLTVDAGDLSRWFVTDLLATLVALAIVGALLFRAGIQRAKRATAEAAQRDAAEAEYRRFLADAGHELKTPLTIVGGYIDVLDERIPQTDSTGRRIVDGMRAETKRMRELVEKMLLLARLEARISVPQLVDALSVAHDVVAELRVRYPHRSIVVDGASRALVVIDEHDLYAAIRNVVENAVRYAPDCEVDVTIAADDERVAITVADTGPGIATDEQALVFQRFYRGSARTDAEGSGLGLSIVRGVAERWDGTIDLASSPQGTSVTLFFPLAVETDR
jgi:two-component system OmpR family sensor kinase